MNGPSNPLLVTQNTRNTQNPPGMLPSRANAPGGQTIKTTTEAPRDALKPLEDRHPGDGAIGVEVSGGQTTGDPKRLTTKTKGEAAEASPLLLLGSQGSVILALPPPPVTRTRDRVAVWWEC